MSPSSCTYRRSPVSILPAASAQNMNASSASGLCARWIVCGPLPATRPPARRRRRLLVERIEVLRVLAVLGPSARTLRRLVSEDVPVGASCPRRVPLELEPAGPHHVPEEVGGDGPADGVRLGQRRRR